MTRWLLVIGIAATLGCDEPCKAKYEILSTAAGTANIANCHGLNYSSPEVVDKQVSPNGHTTWLVKCSCKTDNKDGR